jgi:hypothetical protein
MKKAITNCPRPSRLEASLRNAGFQMILQFESRVVSG